MICDRVAILVDGRLRSTGRLDELVSENVRWFEVTVRSVPPEGLTGELLSRDGRRALLLRLHYRAATRSVTDSEVQSLHDAIVTRACEHLADADDAVRQR